MSKRVKAGSPRVAVAYIRVSKDEQKLSPEAQRAAIEAWAAREGVSVVAWHFDAGVCSVALSPSGRPLWRPWRACTSMGPASSSSPRGTESRATPC